MMSDTEKMEALKKLLNVENFDDVGITLDKVQGIVFDLDEEKPKATTQKQWVRGYNKWKEEHDK